jgi:hypothetical protein
MRRHERRWPNPWTDDGRRRLKQAYIDGLTESELGERFARSGQACMSEVTRMRTTDPSIPMRNPAGRARV